MQDLRLVLVSFNPDYDSVAANRDGICRWVAQAARAGAHLVVFPEGALSGYDLDRKEANARPIDCEELAVIGDLAGRLGIIVSVGLLEKTGDGVYVSQAIIGDGVRAVHRKCHRTGWEKKHCLAGDQLDVQNLPRVTTGTLICYDSAFPAASETLVRKGAELLIQSSCHGQWARDVALADRPAAIAARRTHVLKYWRARAYDYTCFAAYVNNGGLTVKGEWFPSYSGVFGPDGEIIAESLTDGENMLVADLPAEMLERCRRDSVGHFGTLDDARPELYRV